MSKLLSEGGGAPIRQTIEGGFGSGLANAIIDEYKTNPGAYDEKNVYFLGRDLPGVAAAAGEQEWLKLATARFDAFNDHKVEMLQSVFDKFQGLPNIGVPISTHNGPQLRNAYGAAAGFTPTRNLDAAARGDDSVDWFGPGTEGAGARNRPRAGNGRSSMLPCPGSTIRTTTIPRRHSCPSSTPPNRPGRRTAC